MPADLNTRSNIYVLIDEAHRTTGGDLGNFLMAGLPNATHLKRQACFKKEFAGSWAHVMGTLFVFARADLEWGSKFAVSGIPLATEVDDPSRRQAMIANPVRKMIWNHWTG